jgi:hypothetical protein
MRHQRLTSWLLPMLAATMLLQTALPARAGYEWQGSVESLISAILNQASNTLGRAAQVPRVTLSWCKGTFYQPSRQLICFSRPFIQQLAGRVGDAAVAYVAAHEYAHHLQANTPGLLQRAQGNRLRIELQADCYAGRILGSIPNIVFDNQDIREMLTAAAMLGDHEYDSRNHHGAGENRALALRAGLRYASTGKKDNYYDIFCRIN